MHIFFSGYNSVFFGVTWDFHTLCNDASWDSFSNVISVVLIIERWIYSSEQNSSTIFCLSSFCKANYFVLVLWRWRKLSFDHSRLQQVNINNRSFEDYQLEPLMSTAKQVVEVDFFTFYNLTSSCLLSMELSRFGRLTNGHCYQQWHPSKNSCKDKLIDLNLAKTCIRLSKCLPKIVEIKQLKYFPPFQGI